MDRRRNQRPRPFAARSPEQNERMAQRRRTVRLGHQPRRALFRLPNPRRTRQIFLCVAGRARGLHGKFPKPVRQNRLGFQRIFRQRQHRRNVPLHRQRHPVFPRPVLDGHAAIQRPPRPDRHFRARLSDGGRTENVQIARHVHHRQILFGTRPEPRMDALLHRRQAQQQN